MCTVGRQLLRTWYVTAQSCRWFIHFLKQDLTATNAWLACRGCGRLVHKVLMSDGGPEFAGVLARKFEQQGVQHQVTHAGSPWQNGRVERQCQWIQNLLTKSLETRFVEPYSELEVSACKEHSPYQLVFGAHPRHRADLLSDDPTDLVGLSDGQQDAVAADGVAASFAEQHEIRQEEAWRLLFPLDVRRKLAAAKHAAEHRDQNFSRRQWVCMSGDGQ